MCCVSIFSLVAPNPLKLKVGNNKAANSPPSIDSRRYPSFLLLPPRQLSHVQIQHSNHVPQMTISAFIFPPPHAYVSIPFSVMAISSSPAMQVYPGRGLGFLST